MAAIKYALLLAVLAAAVLADDSPYGGRGGDSGEGSEEYDDAKYEFEWSVSEDSNEFGHEESRDGDNTQGSYYVELPDGRTQKVTYYVDGDSGYVAEVSYEGEAEFPEESEESYGSK